jgi:uncharacterized protein (DUF4415 family)
MHTKYKPEMAGKRNKEYVNIRIKSDTWERMQPRKDKPGKTWDDVINELIDQADEGEATRMTPETVD